MPLKKLTPEQTESIRDQANNGASVLALAAKYDISTQHIYRIKSNQRRDRRKKTMSTYNGWTNHATWLFYLHHSEEIYNWHHEHDTESRESLDASDIESFFEDLYHELIEGIDNTYITDVILAELRDVDWREILKTVQTNDDAYDANWTEEGAITNYLDHVAENKERERDL